MELLLDLNEEFKLGMRRLASGVSIIATRDEEGPKGFVATSVSSVALEPTPCLLVCVNRAVSSHDALIRAGVFSVNLLAQPQVDTALSFSSSSKRAERFRKDRWTSLVTGAPVYSDALASFDCELQDSTVIQTHTILIGRAVAVRRSPQIAEPLIYYNGSFTHGPSCEPIACAR